ncbi:MAG: histidinol phosphatase [Oscillospiraceae bacterium]|nr:histidinol phosphatase [Oscillospiraceae bacterium]
MKIDLHCHTRQIKAGDDKNRNVTPEVFREKIINADVGIVAITNHNAFDYEQYIILRDVVKDVCAVWPGIEIDINGSNQKKFHLIVVANPENALGFAEGISALFHGMNLETCKLDLQQVYDTLNKYDVIYIAHIHKKPEISEEDRIKLQAIVGDSSRVFVETSDHRSMGVFANHEYSVLIGSDVQDWAEYEKCTFAELRLPVENFSQFCLLAKRDVVVVDTLRNKKQIYNLIASPYKNIKLPLKIYSDVNVIFGQKGTGKSEILNSLYNRLCDQGVSCVKYTGAEKDDDFSELLKPKDMDRDLSKIGAAECEDAFDLIFKWADSSPTLFTNYSSWYETRDNNANKRSMQITEATYLGDADLPELECHISDHKNIKLATRNLEKVDMTKYLPPTDVASLIRLLQQLSNSVHGVLCADVIEKYAHQLTDFSIERIKLHADKNTDTVSKPSSTGFREFAEGRLKLRKAIGTILQNLKMPEYNEQEYLGELEGKGKVYINKRYRMLDSELSRTEEFSVGIRALKELEQILHKAYAQIFSMELSSVLKEFTEVCENQGIKSVKPFLGLSKQIVLSSGEEYKPSNGERGILLLQQKLGKDADAYFLDEPELGMGNSYIDTNIRPLISALARRHKVVVVATHNANIAVRTLPYTSIFRVHENGVYTTYVGNPFNDMLVNLDDPSDIRSWTTESMHTLEGGEEAFYERKNIYESKSD